MTEQELIAKFYESIKEPDYPEFSQGWYINQYPEPFRSQVFENIIQQGYESRLYDVKPSDVHLNTFLKFSDHNFIWREAPQGERYWNKFFASSFITNLVKE